MRCRAGADRAAIPRNHDEGTTPEAFLSVLDQFRGADGAGIKSWDRAVCGTGLLFARESKAPETSPEGGPFPTKI